MAADLRSVKDGDRPPAKKAKPSTVTQAAASGDARSLLVSMRARVAVAVEDPNTPAQALAALTIRLMQIAKEIEAIDAREKQDGESVGDTAADAEFDPEAL